MVYFPISNGFKQRPAAKPISLGPIVNSPPPTVIPVEVISAAPIPASVEQKKEEIPSLPSMTQMAKNVTKSLAKTAGRFIQGMPIKTSSGEANSRLAICRTCTYFRHTDERCSKCGCFMSVKTYLKAERCPVGKW